jgi:hypothetical protein
MGKHERQSIEEAEKIIVKILNSQKLNDSDKKNHWFKHAIAIAEKIKNDFPGIVSAIHLGNRYDNTGDILVVTNEGEFFLEVKMSDTETGIGTKANISQDALTENRLFMGEVESWSQFRQRKNFDNWVNQFLNRFSRYPQKILRISDPTTQKEEKARYLRYLKEKRARFAENILDIIVEKAKEDKIEYLDYLSGHRQDEEKVKRFLILIIAGIHTKEALLDLINNDNLFQEIQNLFIYYANCYRKTIVVRREETGRKIKKILEEYSSFRIIFPEKLTHCKIVGIKNSASTPLLQIVFHWKNIAQGIKTPCLNIFDLSNG